MVVVVCLVSVSVALLCGGAETGDGILAHLSSLMKMFGGGR